MVFSINPAQAIKTGGCSLQDPPGQGAGVATVCNIITCKIAKSFFTRSPIRRRTSRRLCVTASFVRHRSRVSVGNGAGNRNSWFTISDHSPGTQGDTRHRQCIFLRQSSIRSRFLHFGAEQICWLGGEVEGEPFLPPQRQGRVSAVIEWLPEWSYIFDSQLLKPELEVCMAPLYSEFFYREFLYRLQADPFPKKRSPFIPFIPLIPDSCNSVLAQTAREPKP